MPVSRVPAGVVVLWLASTLVWWAFAFAPLPSGPPPWLTAARAACFGSMPGGLPEASGWMLLVLAPATFFLALVVIWGSELGPSLLGVARQPLGRVLLGLLALAVATESTWVVRKVHVARSLAAWTPGTADAEELPADYPRQARPAPEFTLVDQHGTPVSLRRLAGRPVALTFVFAHCQTMCPLIVATLRHASPGPIPHEVLLVTLDPWRDTPSSLPGIATRWSLPGNFHVLSSRSVADVLKVAEAYGVPFQRDEKTGDITHPGLVFLIDGQGRLTYTFNNPPQSWVREALGRLGRADAHAG